MTFRGPHLYSPNIAAVYGAAGNDADAETLFAAMSPAPDATRKGHINTLIVALKAAGVWAKLDLFYMLAAHSAAPARINWKSPGTYDLSVQGTPVFTTDRGYHGTGGYYDYLDTGWTAADGVQFQQNDAHFAAWNRTDRAADATILFGNANGSGDQVRLYPFYGTDQCYARVNDGGADVANAGGSDGFFLASRTASNSRSIYRNGSLLGTLSDASAARQATTRVFLFGRNDANANIDNQTTDEIAMLAFGANVASAQAAYYAAVAAYMTAVGA